ncbi:MAG: phage portal protein [Bacilli bacterium]|nr:phage portal protein [Bacilli bacterium]
MASLGERLRKSWSVFTGKQESQEIAYKDLGPAYTYRPDKIRMKSASKRTIVPAIINRISVDVSDINICHSKVDDTGMLTGIVNDELNRRLKIDANIDQTGRAFIQDVVSTMLDEGHVAIVPTKRDVDQKTGAIRTIYAWRSGIVKEWFPYHVLVNVYDEDAGERKDLILCKSQVALVQNPLYSIMNEPNSTLQRLLRKIALLDYADEQSTSGKLDMIIQLPYTLNSDKKREQANERRRSVEEQLNGSKYGIAYIDGTERITQLNRSLENNLSGQVKDLQNTLYGQLGLTEAVINGVAKQEEMANYYNRTIKPLLSAIVDEMIRKFISKTAQTQGHSITFFRDPLALADVSQLADMADKLTRNAILSSNEVRVKIGYLPVADERADALSNKNLNENTEGPPPPSTRDTGDEEYNYQDYGDPNLR